LYPAVIRMHVRAFRVAGDPEFAGAFDSSRHLTLLLEDGADAQESASVTRNIAKAWQPRYQLRTATSLPSLNSTHTSG
jgi:hypothetical protein